MGQKNESYVFKTEEEALEYIRKVRASALNGYSEVYTQGPYNLKNDGLWQVSVQTYYG